MSDCGAFSPASDACSLRAGHVGPHSNKYGEEWFLNVWFAGPLSAAEKEAVEQAEAKDKEDRWLAAIAKDQGRVYYIESEAESQAQLEQWRRHNNIVREKIRYKYSQDQYWIQVRYENAQRRRLGRPVI